MTLNELSGLDWRVLSLRNSTKSYKLKYEYCKTQSRNIIRIRSYNNNGYSNYSNLIIFDILNYIKNISIMNFDFCHNIRQQIIGKNKQSTKNTCKEHHLYRWIQLQVIVFTISHCIVHVVH